MLVSLLICGMNEDWRGEGRGGLGIGRLAVLCDGCLFCAVHKVK